MGHPTTTLPEESRSLSSRLSSLYYKDTRRCRVLLVVLSVAIVIGMIIGTIFVAHYYFHSWGGQGFLKARGYVKNTEDIDRLPSCLPLRQILLTTHENHGSGSEARERSRLIVPFYACGDQQNGCEAYSRPNICCPIGMACRPTIYSTSGTYCCISTGDESECQASALRPPKCPNSTFECAADAGGGCCPSGTACSPNGCIEFYENESPTPTTSTIFTTLFYTTPSKAIDSSSTFARTESPILIVTTRKTTITMVIGGATTPTATTQKQGPEAQKAQGVSIPRSGWPSLYLPYSPLAVLVVLALGIALL